MQLGFAFDRRKRRRRRHAAPRGGVPHRARPRFERRMPLHVTVRMAEHVWNLRSLPIASGAGQRFAPRGRPVRSPCRAVHPARQPQVEADNTASLVRAMKGLGVRIARGMNRMMDTRGRVLGDRYHCRVLHTPTEVRRAVTYIRNNHRHHAAGVQFSSGYVDPYSSEAAAVRLPPARTWLVVQALRPPPGT